MNELEIIEQLDSTIAMMRDDLLEKKHKYLRANGWDIRPVSGDDITNTFTYCNGDYTTICEDHAMEELAENDGV